MNREKAIAQLLQRIAETVTRCHPMEERLGIQLAETVTRLEQIRVCCEFAYQTAQMDTEAGTWAYQQALGAVKWVARVELSSADFASDLTNSDHGHLAPTTQRAQADALGPQTTMRIAEIFVACESAYQRISENPDDHSEYPRGVCVVWFLVRKELRRLAEAGIRPPRSAPDDTEGMFEALRSELASGVFGKCNDPQCPGCQ